VGPVDSRSMQHSHRWQKHLKAASESAELISNTLGPRGLSKLVVSPYGYNIVSNDAHRILKEIDTGYPLVRSLPSVQALIGLTNQQAQTCGDGTATTILWATELLKQALALQEKGIHPQVIEEGYALAVQEADRLLDGLALKVEVEEGGLRNIAVAALLGRVEEEDLSFVSRLVTRLFQAVWPEEPADDSVTSLEQNNVKVFTRPGALLRESRVIDGLIVNRHRADRRMPRVIKSARVALIDFEISLPPIKGYQQEVRIGDGAREDWYEELIKSRMKGLVDDLAQAGVSVIFTSYNLPELANHHLARRGILAVERTKKSDLEKLSLATGARLIKLPEEISPDVVGRARIVEERNIMGNRMVFVEGTCGRVATLFLRGPTRGGLDEVERACRGALLALAAFANRPQVLPGGGGVEVYLARELAALSSRLAGKLQLVSRAFARSLEVIPRTLMYNAGVDPFLILPRLQHRQATAQNSWIGFNSRTRRLEDMSRGRVWDSLAMKRNALHLATSYARDMIGVDGLLGDLEAEPIVRRTS
jgi:archaeal chaperonin